MKSIRFHFPKSLSRIYATCRRRGPAIVLFILLITTGEGGEFAICRGTGGDTALTNATPSHQR